MTIINVEDKEELNNTLMMLGRRNIDSIVIGSNDTLPDAANILNHSGHQIATESIPLTHKLMKAHKVRPFSPARYEYYKKLANRKEVTKLPRSRKTDSKMIRRIIGINYA